jgi:nucleoside-diphosphate-sugar epimerase
MTDGVVLVTGGSGFVGSHCILALLDAGYRVRTTVRSLDKEPAVRAMLALGGYSGAADRVTFAAADLLSDAGWVAAVEGCEFVLHVASPFPLGTPKDENDLIIPAREGALRVLRASRDAGVKRVVLTSSFAAIAYGRPDHAGTFTEKDWSDPDGVGISAYAKSKTLAERAAWDYIGTEGGSLELAVVNPVGVFGPTLSKDYSTSVEIVKRIINGELPGLPDLSFGTVDVRDVADLHLRAMINPAAKGERFLAIAGAPMSLVELSRVLKQRMGEVARHAPTGKLPNWVVRLLAVFSPPVRQIVPDLGKVKLASNEKAKTVLGWAPRSNEDAVVATAESLVALGLVKK